MELKTYFKILLKRWWLVLLGLGLAAVVTLLWTSRQDHVYESKATYIIRPRSSLVVDSEFVRALDIVSRRVEINTTFAEVSASRSIREVAMQKLNLPPENRKGLTVSGVVTGGTNVLTITTQGPNPLVVRDFANAVGEATVEYVGNLYDVFELQPLDSATIPSRPVSPNYLFNMLIGSFAGLAIGVGTAFAVEYIQSPYTEPDSFNIIDRDTGAYNKSYFMLRMSQEFHRAKRNQYPLTLILLKIDLEGESLSVLDRRELMRVFKLLAEKNIREDDILARINSNTFAILFPFMPGTRAEIAAEELKTLIDSVARDVLPKNQPYSLRAISGVTTVSGDLYGEDMLSRATNMINASMVSTNEMVRSI